MPIKIFSAPGDHRDDFKLVEDQVNQWMTESSPGVISVQSSVTGMPDERKQGQFLMTVLVHYK